MVDFSKWWEYDPKEIISQVYWLRGQLPPAGSVEYHDSMTAIIAGLTEKYPPPNPNLDDDEQPKDDCNETPQVVAVIRPKVNWYARWMQ